MNEQTPPLSTRRAFLIHFRAGNCRTADELCGRVEHVSSGRAEHFANADELWAFVFRTLDDLEHKPDGQVQPRKFGK
jgi:hypothetical protein